MTTVENYALVLIFYVLVGTLQGVGNASLAAERAGVVKNHPGYLVCSGAGLIYAFLGIGSFGRVGAIYVYLPVLLLWWAGNRFGRRLYPIADLAIRSFIAACLLGSASIYHFAL